MSDKAKLFIVQIAIVAVWIMFFLIIVKDRTSEKSERKPGIGQKEVYQFEEVKDWNTENLTTGQRLYYEQITD